MMKKFHESREGFLLSKVPINCEILPIKPLFAETGLTQSIFNY